MVIKVVLFSNSCTLLVGYIFVVLVKYLIVVNQVSTHLFSFCTVSNYNNTCVLDFTPNKSPSQNLKYFYHFRKDFLPPYGIAHNDQSFSDEKMQARIEAINCEFIIQPWIGVSRFAETMLANGKFLEESKDLLDSENLTKFLKKLNRYEELLEVFSSKSDAAGNW